MDRTFLVRCSPVHPYVVVNQNFKTPITKYDASLKQNEYFFFFVLQASANTILSHFVGLVFSLELLRSVTLPPSEAPPFLKFA